MKVDETVATSGIVSLADVETKKNWQANNS